ncbi:hypothetical protein ACXOM2_02605, partial [Streptococcus thermophilus]
FCVHSKSSIISTVVLPTTEIIEPLKNRAFSYTLNIQYKYIIKTHKFFYNQPVIDAQPKPLINLQWLFNLIYQSRFN